MTAVKATPHRDERDQGLRKHGASPLKPQLATHDRTYDCTITYALTAMQQIHALQAPADPASFHLWYAYATKAFPAINQTINETISRDGSISVDALDHLYNQYLSTGTSANRVQKVGIDINDEVNRVIDVIDAAIGTGADYADHLSGASKRLADTKDQESLREIIGMLVSSTRKVEQQNRTLQQSLKSSKDEIDALQKELLAIGEESHTDPLTSLGNRKLFTERLDRAIKNSEENVHRPLSLLMCDIDYFKRFNDTFGHVVGDQMLCLFASVMKASIRNQDTAARYGGEEFAVVLPDTALRHASAVAESLRSAIIERKIVKRSTGENLGRLTVSIGVAQFRRGDTAQMLIERADSCLYAAKNAGRNRVVSEADNPAVQLNL